MALKDKYITVSEAARLAGVTRQTISRWITEGHLIAEKVGRQALIDKKDFAQYLMRQNTYRMASQIIDGVVERIRQEYNYTEEDKVEFLKLDFKKDIFHFSVVKKDGNHEVISVSVSKPEKLSSKGEPFLLIGYKFHIRKMERRKTKI